MKRILTLITIITITATCAVNTNAQFRWGATAGININNLSFKQDIVDVSKTVGYQAGVLGELMFPGIGFGFEFGLAYDQQGAKVDLGSRKIWASDGYANEQVYLHNIHIPIHLKFKYTRLNGIENKIAPLAYAGPELNLQVAHGSCEAFKYSGGDLGLTVGIGAELYKRFQISGAYTWGMTYALKTQLLENFSAVSRQWSVRLSYFF